MKRRDWPALVLAGLGPLLVGALASGCAESQAATPTPDAPRSEALAVTRGEFRSRMLLTGELKAEDAVRLIAPNVNIWPLQVRWVAQDGIEVAEGDPAVEFDSTQLLSNLEEMIIQAYEAESQLESEMARVPSEIAEAELALERQKAEFDKAKLQAEVPKKLRSDREHEMSQLALKRAEFQLAGAERQLENARTSGKSDIELKKIALAKARNEVAKAQGSIGKLTLRSPRAGILIISENHQEGRSFRPGDTAWPGMPVAELPELDTLGVEARLFDVDDERIQPGQRVRARLDAFPEREYTGRVREVDEMAHQDGRFSMRRFFNVKVTLDEVDPELMRPGMSVKLEIETPPVPDALLVPRAAIDWSGEAPRAALASARLVPVELGPCNAFHCVVESGVDEGDALRSAWEVTAR